MADLKLLDSPWNLAETADDVFNQSLLMAAPHKIQLTLETA